MVDHFRLDVEIRSESGRVAMTPAGEGAREHIGRLHRPASHIAVGDHVELRMVGRHLGPGRVDLSCRIVALYHHEISRPLELGAAFQVTVIRAMQRGRRRNPADVFGDLDEGRIPHFEGVVGNLELMGLPDLLQNLEAHGKSGLLEVQSDAGVRGGVWLERGRLRHAQLAELDGVDAFFALLGLQRGMFRLREGVTSPGRSLNDAPVSHLLLEGMRRFDERAAFDDFEDELDVTDPSLSFDIVFSDEGSPLPC